MAMTIRMSGRVVALALVGLLVGSAPAGSPDAVSYPAGYRQWQVIKFKLIGPTSPNYEREGGFRRHFANERVIAGIRPAQARAACFDVGHESRQARAFVFGDPRA